MIKLAQWLKDKRWANNMLRIRRFERSLLFSEREIFYNALQPYADVGAIKFAWPQAIMFIKIDDIIRAIQAVHNYRIERRKGKLND